MSSPRPAIKLVDGAEAIASEGDRAARGLLHVQDLCFSDPKSETPLLNGVAFDVYKGDCLAILGARKTGRSLLIRLLAGNVQPTSGRVSRLARVSFPLGEAPPCCPKTLPIGAYVRGTAAAYGADADEVGAYFDEVDYLGFDPAMPWQKLQPTDGKKLGIALGLAIPFDVYLFDDFTLSWVNDGVLAWMFAARRARSSFVLTTRIIAGVENYATRIALLQDGALITYTSIKEGVLAFRALSKPQQAFTK